MRTIIVIVIICRDDSVFVNCKVAVVMVTRSGQHTVNVRRRTTIELRWRAIGRHRVRASCPLGLYDYRGNKKKGKILPNIKITRLPRKTLRGTGGRTCNPATAVVVGRYTRGRSADERTGDQNAKNGGPADGVRDVPETNRNTTRTGLLGGKIGPGRHPGAAEKRAGIRSRIFRRAHAAT